MPHFTLQLDPINGPLLTAFIGISAARAMVLQSAKKPVPTSFQARALVDTGASCACVDPMIIQHLGLDPRGKTAMATPSTDPGQNKEVDQYDVSILIASAPNQFPHIIPTIPVIETPLFAKFGYHAILGRDVLSSIHFTYNGAMRLFTFAY